MKHFYSEKEGTSAISNFPIRVNQAESKPVDLEESEIAKIGDSHFSLTVVDKKVKFIKNPPLPCDIAREGLKAKLEAGTASDEDVKSALKLLL